MLLFQTPTGKGTLALYITDKPALSGITSVDIAVSKIEVHRAGLVGEPSETNETEDTNDTSEVGWETVVNESKTFDLLQIQGVEEFLGSEQLDEGRYTQIRLVISSGTVTIENETHDLKIPSSAFKLVRTFTIEPNKTTTLVFDFNAGESVVQADGKYILKPVIQLIMK